MAASRLMDAIAVRPLVLDSAMGTRLIARGLDLARDDPALWNLSRPEDVFDCHRRDVAAGADALVTNTFGANRATLERLGRASDFLAINRRAVSLAREAAGPGRFVLGSIGPEASFGDEAVDARPAYREQADILIDAGVDALLLETHTWDQASRALWNLDAKAITILVSLLTWPEVEAEALRGKAGCLWFMGAEALGTNCATIESVIGWAEALSRQVSAPLIARPSAGLPGGSMASPEDFAAMARAAISVGARLIGGCCGTDERHVAAIRSALPAS